MPFLECFSIVDAVDPATPMHSTQDSLPLVDPRSLMPLGFFCREYYDNHESAAHRECYLPVCWPIASKYVQE